MLCLVGGMEKWTGQKRMEGNREERGICRQGKMYFLNAFGTTGGK